MLIDPEEELNIFDAPKRDKQNQYRHFRDQTKIILKLAREMLQRAKQLEDFAGVELASRILRQKGDENVSKHLNPN